jgi:hypothetical protein
MPFENKWFALDKQTYNRPAYQNECVILKTASTLGVDPDLPMQLAILDNEIAEGKY